MKSLRPFLFIAIAIVALLGATTARTQTAAYKSSVSAKASGPNKHMTILFQNGASLAIDFAEGSLDDLPSRVRTGSGSAVLEFNYRSKSPDRTGSIVVNVREVTAVTVETP